ncbi:MAG: hypothetical protein IJM46_01945 [Oscillospiraceae bacterium]|nr:hypothetical protein [Oscillospiraceae bacterium]
MKQIKCIAAALAMLLLAGCAENPDSDIVIHKDMEKLIDEAQQTDESRAEVADFQQYDHYTAELENEGLHVTVHADADVDIPQTEKLSVFRVKQHTFTDADIETFRQALFGDAQLYDGILMAQTTKSDLEPQIADARASLDKEKAREPKTDREARDRDTMMQELQKYLDDLQTQYEAAPFEAALVPTDGKLQNVAEKLASGENASYWQWLYDLESEEVVEMRTADNHASLFISNNPDRGNCLCYSASPVGTEFMTILGTMYKHNLNQAQTKIGSDIPMLLGGHDPSAKLTPIPNDSAELSQEDAQKQAEEFLHKVGLDDFAFSEGGKYQVYLDLRTKDGNEYKQTCYVLHYYRCFDGVMLDQASGSKFAEDWEGGSYRKQEWGGEVVEFMVNDAGIVGFSWNTPLEIMETVVDHAALKPFETVRDTFEKMMPMTGATQDPEHIGADISIDRVTLTYSRISEKDSFDTGLVVPVWGFRGTRKEVMVGEGYGMNPTYYTQMAINAIDGSVIDGILGY